MNKEKKSFVLNNVSAGPIKQRTVIAEGISQNFCRQNSYRYYLKDESGTLQIVCMIVCKVFFLKTLGFKKKNDKVLRNIVSKSINKLVPSPSETNK